MGILPQAFGEEVEGAGWNGFGGCAIAEVKVADHYEHGVLLKFCRLTGL
jgi:hypothetical protein